jgi:hypothetical protein
MTTAELIRQAMGVLEEMPTGAIGETGPTIEEMIVEWEKGSCYGNDATYDTCQHVWRLLEMALASFEAKP